MTDRTDKGRPSRGGKPNRDRPVRGGKTDSDRPARGAKPGRAGEGKPDRDRPVRGGKPGKAGAGKPDRDRRKKDDREPGQEGASKRFGRRPPKSGRTGPVEFEKRTGTRGDRKEGAGTGRPAKRDDVRTGPPTKRASTGAAGGGKKWSDRPERPAGRFVRSGKRPGNKARKEKDDDDGLIRLNRYLAMSGVASRREADDLIKAGVVSVNGTIVTEMGTKVGPGDRVHYGGQRLSREQKRYVLLNKPKDFITTTDDPRDRRTVMALVEKACTERLYPVGRLDRHTTGVLLMTNDGDLAKKLTHPSHGAEKIYHVTLDKSVTKADLEKLVTGVELEDGQALADEASYVQGESKREVGLKLHMGRNRIVRRMFEELGYAVVKLDRVVFAGLTKKGIPRSEWRHLTESEVLFLKKRK